MAEIVIPQRFAQRRDTSANWVAKNPILWNGEFGLETDVVPYKLKIGDGVTQWNSLPYGGGSSGGGGSASLAEYKFSNSTSSSPPDKYWRMNNATPASVTTLYFHENTNEDTDANILFLATAINDRITCADSTDSGKYVRYKVTALPVDAGTYWSVTVVHEASASTIPNDAVCDVSFKIAGTNGTNGTNGINGTNGTDGVDGVDGVDAVNPEYQANATHIQWRLVGSPTWIDLLPLSDIGLGYAYFGCTFDGGGIDIVANAKCDITVPYDCTITKVTLLADASGSIVIDVWKDTFSNYPPDVADTIAGAGKPTLSSANKMINSTLTGWTTGVSAGDCIRFNIDSCTGIKRAMLLIEGFKI